MKKMLLATLLATLLAGSSHAMLITNVTDGTTLFSNDGFEQDTVGTPPSYAENGVIYTRNNPLVYTGTGTGIGASACPDGAYEGNNYMYFGRVTGDASRYATVKFQGGDITTDGKTVQVDFAAYFGADAYIGINLLYDCVSSSSYTAKLTDWRFNSGTTSTGLSTGNYAVNEWVECSIVYTTGEGSATVTVGNASFTGTVNWNSMAEANQRLAGISLIGMADKTSGVYIDLIPEPMSVSLFVVAGMTVLFLRRLRG